MVISKWHFALEIKKLLDSNSKSQSLCHQRQLTIALGYLFHLISHPYPRFKLWSLFRLAIVSGIVCGNAAIDYDGMDDVRIIACVHPYIYNHMINL